MHLQWWLPPLAACIISFFTSMVGISGGFLLLPLQVSVFGITTPAVSGTNLVFNLFATPGGIYRFWREKRILWPLVGTVVAGTTPGVVVGGFIRLSYLADVGRFKIFVAFVLLWVGLRLLADILKPRQQEAGGPPPATGDFTAATLRFTPRALTFLHGGHQYECKPLGIFVFSLFVGVIGGIYGIGGAVMIAPFLVTVYRLPVFTITGATLTTTLATSVVGVAFYQLIAPLYGSSMAVAPDWWLGVRLGLGGLVGVYLGALAQRHFPALYLKIMLALIVLGLSLSYLWGFARR